MARFEQKHTKSPVFPILTWKKKKTKKRQMNKRKIKSANSGNLKKVQSTCSQVEELGAPVTKCNGASQWKNCVGNNGGVERDRKTEISW